MLIIILFIPEKYSEFKKNSVEVYIKESLKGGKLKPFWEITKYF